LLILFNLFLNSALNFVFHFDLGIQRSKLVLFLTTGKLILFSLQPISLLLSHRILLMDLCPFSCHLNPFSFKFSSLLVEQSLFFIKYVSHLLIVLLLDLFAEQLIAAGQLGHPLIRDLFFSLSLHQNLDLLS
jgi:hypothetical protein